MDWYGLTERARDLVGQARRVYAAFPDRAQVTAVQVTDPNTSAVHPMYLPELVDLVAFRETIQGAQRFDPVARNELPRQIAIIEQEFGLN